MLLSEHWKGRQPVVLKGESDQQVELDPCKSEAEILARNVKIVFCHPESLLTPKGRNIVKALVSFKKLLLVTHDEIQLYFKWGRSIREEMLSAPAEMRAIAPNVPTLYMTATFRYSEIEAMKKELCVKEPCVVISCSPVLPQREKAEKPAQEAADEESAKKDEESEESEEETDSEEESSSDKEEAVEGTDGWSLAELKRERPIVRIRCFLYFACN